MSETKTTDPIVTKYQAARACGVPIVGGRMARGYWEAKEGRC